ncbi:hypothetical protein ACFWQ6_12610 [Streptomyces coelicoflavus]|uniref:hypothetical protein n=1 Tax=Streptomyces coelicoflavus TaxID=285562 RepID=UPI00365155D7
MAGREGLDGSRSAGERGIRRHDVGPVGKMTHGELAPQGVKTAPGTVREDDFEILATLEILPLDLLDIGTRDLPQDLVVDRKLVTLALVDGETHDDQAMVRDDQMRARASLVTASRIQLPGQGASDGAGRGPQDGEVLEFVGTVRGGTGH